MNKKLISVLSVLVVIVFIGYIIFDVSKSSGSENVEINSSTKVDIPDAWAITKDFKVSEGKLEAVSVSPGKIYLGGASFVSCYDSDLKLIWNLKTPAPVTSLANSGDSIFASTSEQILVISTAGKMLGEWGPFEDSSLITSVTVNMKYVAFADAGNRIVFVLDKGGEVKKMIGQGDKQFFIPSPYFEVVLDKDNTLYTANTGKHRVETRNINGDILSYFGAPGTDPGYFCGCCAPPHFILIPDGFVTAEKGINRIKILNKKGEFVEFVNSHNNFMKSVPLDLASLDGKTIYGAYPEESKLFVFNRK
jgi:DNA-binding beta-propeller fold protein YncE